MPANRTVRVKSAASHRVASIFRTPTPALLYTVALVDSDPAIPVSFPRLRMSPWSRGKYRGHILGAYNPASRPSSPNLFSEEEVMKFRGKGYLRGGCGE